MDLSIRNKKVESGFGPHTPDSGLLGSSSSDTYEGSSFSTPLKERREPKTSAAKVFAQKMYSEQKDALGGASFTEFQKNVAPSSWKKMSPGEKEYFERQANDINEKNGHVKGASGQRGSSGKRKRGPKDPNAPKRNLSAFFHFCNQRRPKVREEHPNATVGDVAKILGRQWSEIKPADKEVFEKLAMQDKKRYQLVKAAYEQQKEMQTSSASTPMPTYSGEPSNEYDFHDEEEESAGSESEDSFQKSKRSRM